jgi:hypothetical protein
MGEKSKVNQVSVAVCWRTSGTGVHSPWQTSGTSARSPWQTGGISARWFS